MIVLCKMENQPEQQDLETVRLLKKGKYGFYKQVDKIHSVYGDAPVKGAEVVAAVDPPIKQPVAFSAFQADSETNHYLHPDKIQEFLQGLFTNKLWATGKEGFGERFEEGFDGKEGFDDGAGKLEEEAKSQFKDTTQSVEDEGKKFMKKLKNAWMVIQNDMDIIGDPHAKQSDKIKGFIRLIKDILVLMYTFVNMFSISTHPNFIDMSGKVLTKMFVDTDTGGLFDKEKSRVAILYFTLIAYASVFIFIAYVVSENWFYFLVYPFSENIMTKTAVDEEGKETYKEWSLEAWWAYYEKKQPTLFGVFHALFYTTTAIDSLLRKLRGMVKNTTESTGYYDDYSPLFRILIFLGIYYSFNYWTTITESPVFDIIILIFMSFAVLRICAMTHGSVGFTEPPAYYAPGMLSFVITLIKGFVLWTINYSLVSIGKLAIYAYFMFISFGFISFSETTRKKDMGMIGRYRSTVEEMGKYHLLNSQMLADKVNGNKESDSFTWAAANLGIFLELNWLSVSVILIFLIMFFSLMAVSGNNVYSFAPIFYFILVFWCMSILKIIINCFAKWWFYKGSSDTALDKDTHSQEIKNTLSQIKLSQNNTGKIDIKPPKYETGIVKAAEIIFRDTPKQLNRDVNELASDIKYIGKNIYNTVRKTDPQS